MLGIILGVAALIIVMGVMNGFDKELEQKIIGVNPHVFIKSFSGVFNYNPSLIRKLQSNKKVKCLYPVLAVQGIVTSGTLSSGAVINGVIFSHSNQIKRYIHGSTEGAVVGYELMKMLGLKVGDYIRIILPFGKTTPFGFAPLSFKVRVTGTFKSGMYDYDTTFVYLPLKLLWEKTDMKGKINAIAIILKNPYTARKFAYALAQKLGDGFYTSNWMDLNSSFFSALKLEKFAMFIILTLIVIVAAFNITSSLMMIAMEKIRDMAILLSFGAKRHNIRNIFIKQALIIAIIGVSIGDTLGLTLSYLLKKYQFIKLPSDVYYINTIPVELSYLYVIIISAVTFLLVFAASLYPARKASRVNIIEVLRQ